MKTVFGFSITKKNDINKKPEMKLSYFKISWCSGEALPSPNDGLVKMSSSLLSLLLAALASHTTPIKPMLIVICCSLTLLAELKLRFSGSDMKQSLGYKNEITPPPHTHTLFQYTWLSDRNALFFQFRFDLNVNSTIAQNGLLSGLSLSHRELWL